MEHEVLRDLKDLSRQGRLAILPADKGNATVVMDSTQYASKLGELLQEDSYQLLPRNPTCSIEKQVHETLKSIECEGNQPGKLKKLTPRQSTMPQIYGLPKIHRERGTTVSHCVHHWLTNLCPCQGTHKDHVTTHWKHQLICEEFYTLCRKNFYI